MRSWIASGAARPVHFRGEVVRGEQERPGMVRPHDPRTPNRGPAPASPRPGYRPFTPLHLPLPCQAFAGSRIGAGNPSPRKPITTKVSTDGESDAILVRAMNESCIPSAATVPASGVSKETSGTADSPEPEPDRTGAFDGA